MAAGKLDINIEQGAEFRMELTLKLGGVPVDLSQHTFAAQMRKTMNAQEVVAEMKFSEGDASGRITASIKGEETAKIPCQNPAPPRPGQAVPCERPVSMFLWDLMSIDETGRRFRWLEGVAKVSPMVTRVT